MVELNRERVKTVSPHKPEADRAAGKATQKMTSLIEDFLDKPEKPTDQIEEIKEPIGESKQSQLDQSMCFCKTQSLRFKRYYI